MSPGLILKRLAITQALTAAVLFGISTPLAHGLLRSTSPQVLAGLLYLGSGTGLGALWLTQGLRRVKRESSLVRRDLPWLSGAILFGGVLGPLLLMLGLSRNLTTKRSVSQPRLQIVSMTQVDSRESQGLRWTVVDWAISCA